MTRKEFVKKMMGKGYSRTEAIALAARANRYGISYADRWAYENSKRGRMAAAVRKTAKAVRAKAAQIAARLTGRGGAKNAD